MWWYSDPNDWTEVAERRWKLERSAAAQRRLALGGRQPRHVPVVLLRAQQLIEHMVYLLAARREAKSEEPADTALSDAQIARLLALIASNGEVLRIEPVEPRGREPNDESRASGF